MPKKRSKTRPSKAPLDTDIQSQSTDNIRADDGVHELGPSSSKIPRSSLSEMQVSLCVYQVQGFLVFSEAEIRPLSQWNLGDFFPN